MIPQSILFEGKQFSFNHFSEKDKMFQNHKRSGTFYELILLKKLRELNPKGTFVDVGANIGNHTVFFSNFMNPDLIFAIEPQEQLIPVIGQNVDSFCKTPVIIENSIAHFEENNLQMGVFDIWNTGATTVLNVPGNTPAKTIDSFNLENVGLMKIDVEGAEINVIKGAMKTIREFSPIITAELTNTKQFRDFYNLIRPLGYKTDHKNYAYTPTYIFTK